MFRPCIDLHNGQVKQIVGGSLDNSEKPLTNFVSDKEPSWYAKLYRDDQATGGHVIKLGPGNDQAAQAALQAWPGGLQVGGGITADNAKFWLDTGASHIIMTSYIFHHGQFDQSRLKQVLQTVGKERLVLDLSCRKRDGKYFIVTDRWQKFTDIEVNPQTLEQFSQYCDEYLIHAVDVEGLSQGIDLELVEMIAEHSPISSTYAGGAQSIEDLKKIYTMSQGRVGLTIGSALDIFGGDKIKYQDCIEFNKKHTTL